MPKVGTGKRAGHMAAQAYARHRRALGLPGQTHKAVQRAMDSGRLQKSVRNRKIIDVELADREWEANTDDDLRPGAPDVTNDRGRALLDAKRERARLDAARADLAEMELAEREGRLVDAAEVVRRWCAHIASAKVKLLALPAKARQRDPGLTTPQLGLMMELIRDALTELSEGK